MPESWTHSGSSASTIPTSPKSLLAFGVKSAFVEMLEPLISAHFKSRRAFARATAPGNEDAAQSYVTQVLKEEKPPPIDRLPAWADALELYGEDRQRFMDLAAIAHLPVEAQPRFIGLLRTLKSVEARLDALESQRNGVSKK